MSTTNCAKLLGALIESNKNLTLTAKLKLKPGLYLDWLNT